MTDIDLQSKIARFFNFRILDENYSPELGIDWDIGRIYG